MRCSVLQFVAAGAGPQVILCVRLSDTVFSSVLQCVAVCGSVWKCVAACGSVL